MNSEFPSQQSMSHTKVGMRDTDSRRSDRKQSIRKKKKKQRRHRQHSKRYSRNDFDREGVVHVVMDDLVQNMLHCVVGVDVTAEKPWIKVPKDIILEQVDMEEIIPEFMPFAPYKQEFINFKDDEMLVGYIADEQREYDEFYLCLTAAAQEQVVRITKAMEKFQQARLDNTINKVVHEWHSLGSHIEIAENTPTNTRGLYKIEFVTKYPIMHSNVTFTLRLVEQIRDGYMELKIPTRYTISNIYRKRISTATQVAPSIISSEAQTNCPYPKNMFTQYEYLCKFQAVTKEFIETFQNYFSKKIEPICDALYVNYNINFYKNDYYDLSQNEFSQFVPKESNEYMSFKDIKRCKDKMISAVAWHPLWSGIVAIAYADLSTRCNQSVSARYDLVTHSIYGINPVLIWSFNDGLLPKLVLQTNSEVHCLQFCPHNENLLVGGCRNGQVILWDITNKINKVEEEEILTTAQQHYRVLMFSMMKWMRNTRDISTVPVTALSHLSSAHKTNVTAVQWIHPLYNVSKSGHFVKIEEQSEKLFSLEFVSSSADGTLKFWNLKQIPVALPGDYKPQRKSRRLKKRPSALSMDASPFRILNRKMHPHFQINVVMPKDDNRMPIASLELLQTRLELAEVDPNPNREFKITDRIYFKPVTDETKVEPPLMSFAAGTYCGDFILGSWDGFDYTSPGSLRDEQCKILNTAKYHDGPILCTFVHPSIPDLFLTVGGTVFAIWKSHLLSRPVFWRRSKYRYTYGSWSKYMISCVTLNRSDGNREIWDLNYKTDTFYKERAYSGKSIFEGVVHPIKIKENVFSIADTHGSLRLVYVPNERKTHAIGELNKFKKIIDESVARKIDFAVWQEKWIEKNASWILEQRAKAEADEVRRLEEVENRKLLEMERKELEAAKEAKMAAAKLRPPPGHYTEWAHEQWIINEQARMGNVFLSKKRVNRETLIAQQIPLKILEREVEKKRQKQRERIQNADEIFNVTIAMLFPELVENQEKTTPLYTPEELCNLKEQLFSTYSEIKKESDAFVEENPFTYEFDWLYIVEMSKEKRYRNEFKFYDSHKKRREFEKRPDNQSLLRFSSPRQVKMFSSKANQMQKSDMNL